MMATPASSRFKRYKEPYQKNTIGSEDLLSKSWGAYSGKTVLQRHMSDVAKLLHAGWLLKRSNRPYSRTSTELAAPFDTPYHDNNQDEFLKFNDDEHSLHLSSLEQVPSQLHLPQHLQLQSELLNMNKTTSPTGVESKSECFSDELNFNTRQQQKNYLADGDIDKNVGNDKKDEVTDENKLAEKSHQFAYYFLGVDLKQLSVKPALEGSRSMDEEKSENEPVVNLCPRPSAPIPMSRNVNKYTFGAADESPLKGMAHRSSNPISITKAHSCRTPVTRENGEHGPCSDFIDPKDGHVWRAKYCVLENGVLYFYRHESDAEESSARRERQRYVEERQQHHQRNLALSPIPTILWKNDEEDSGYSWEKCIALNSVAAVRSAELEHGENAFELSPSDSENTDKLILRARNAEEMNEWLFRFHQSIASFLMDIMECASQTAPMMKDDIHTSVVHHAAFHARNNGNVNNMVPPITDSPARSTTLPYHLTAFSPLHQRPISSTNSASLSHGHGRNSLHRRRTCLVSPHAQSRRCISQGGRMAMSLQDTPQLPFLPTTAAVPSLSFLSRNINAVGVNRSMPPFQQHEFEAEFPPELTYAVNPEAAGDNPETERPRPTHSSAQISCGRNFVLPHARNRQATSLLSAANDTLMAMNTVPCSSRSTSAASSAVPSTGFSTTESNANVSNQISLTPCNDDKSKLTLTPSSSKPSRKYVPPYRRNNNNNKTQSQQETPCCLEKKKGTKTVDSSDDSSKTPVNNTWAGNTSLYVPQTDKKDLVQEHTNVKLGGCADPSLVTGSILDKRFIPRKASRLNKVHSIPFGSISSSHVSPSTLRWEIGAVSECGVRESNEDSYLIISDIAKLFGDHRRSSNVWNNPSSKHSSGLFAVFDGHCGDHASRFAAEKLISYIEDHSVRRLRELGVRGDVYEVEDILRDAITDLDREFCTLCVEEGREWESGTTALIAALVNEHLIIANLGDARGVMCRSVATRDEAFALEEFGWTELPSIDHNSVRRCLWKEVSEVHHPARNDERARIEKANGWITTEKEIPVGQLKRMVLCDQDVLAILKRCFADRYQPSPKAAAPQRILQISRVCGELAVSRAIGDRDFKAAFNNPTQSSLSDDTDEPEWVTSLDLPFPDDHNRSFVGDLVSNKPDFQMLRVGENGVSEEFLLMACDGLWDVMDADDAVRVTRDLLYEKGWSAKLAANRLAELAVHLGSSDNITVIVIRFHDRQNVAESESFVC